VKIGQVVPEIICLKWFYYFVLF